MRCHRTVIVLLALLIQFCSDLQSTVIPSTANGSSIPPTEPEKEHGDSNRLIYSSFGGILAFVIPCLLVYLLTRKKKKKKTTMRRHSTGGGGSARRQSTQRGSTRMSLPASPKP